MGCLKEEIITCFETRTELFAPNKILKKFLTLRSLGVIMFP